MNEELQTQLIGYLGSIESSVSTASGFVSEQAPLVVQEYLSWYYYSSLACAIAFGVVTAALLIGCVICFYNQMNNFSGDGWGLSGMGSGVIGVCTLFITGVHCYNVAYVCLAPKLVVLDYIQSLVS